MKDLQLELRKILVEKGDAERPHHVPLPFAARRRIRRRQLATVGVTATAIAAFFVLIVVGTRIVGTGQRPQPRPAGDPDRPVTRSYPFVNDIHLTERGLWVAGGNRGAPIALLDPFSLRVTDEIAGGGEATASIDTGHGATWVVSRGRGLIRVDPSNRSARRTDIDYASRVSVGSRWVWTHDGEGTVEALDPRTGKRTLRVVLPVGEVSGRETHDLAADELGGAWLAEAFFPEDRRGGVVHIRPDGTTSRLVLGAGPAPDPDGPYTAVAWPGGGFIWVCCDASGRVAQIDPAAERILGYPITIPGAAGYSEPIMTFGGGALYSEGSEGVYRFDPATGDRALVFRLEEEQFATAITADEGAVWIAWSDEEGAGRGHHITRVPLS